ncbi:MAG TPA: hypothetical protein VMR20_17120 [Verrucomicrobiae bacterium]|nr:hypothetical protein [Verrucomicrobiae bacterium]
MKEIGFYRGGERGLVLFSSLTILTVLLAAGIGIRTMLQNDYRVLANLRTGTEAFYYAVAGIEWSKSEIGGAIVMPPAPENRTLGFAAGSFSVAFQAPLSLGPLAASVVVRSTGVLGTSSHTLQAKFTRTFDLADAALGLRGNGGAVNLTGGPILISGADHDPVAGQAVPGAKSRPAISTSDETLRSLVEQALDHSPHDVFDGAKPEVAASDYLPPAAVSQLVETLCASPSALVTALPETGELAIDNQTWGTPAAPELRCFQGLASGGDTLTLAGNISGSGILVVRDADLALTGTFHWQGWVIVTGDGVGLRATGIADKEIYGGTVINEAGNPGSDKSILEIQGALRLRFSRQGMAAAMGFISSAMAHQAAPTLPFVITQNYWRTITP